MRLVHTVERLLLGTPLEPFARRLYQQIHSLGHPRRRQSLRYDRDMVRIMARILQPDTSCADVGAHRGSLLEEMVQLAPRGRHFAFEPLPQLAARLRQRFPGVAVHEVALSDRDGESSFQYAVDDPGRSGLRRMPKLKAGTRVEEIRVQTARLDDLVPAAIPLRFIKVDVEGAELEVLSGASRTLANARQATWLVEVCLTEHHPDGINPDFARVFETFWSNGYTAWTLDRARTIERDDVSRWVEKRARDFGSYNVIFARQAT